MALFSSGFTPGASRKRTTRIYSPATAFMHLPAQPVPVSKAVTSAQMQLQRFGMPALHPPPVIIKSPTPTVSNSKYNAVMAAMHFTASAIQANST